MNRDRDMVDSALSSLRSVRYDGPSFDLQLEERLMKEFDKASVSRRFIHRPAVAAALGILVLGGGAFAAGGGIDYIKSLFVTVEVDGQKMDVELQPIGNGTHEGELSTTLGDGRDAHIQVRKTDNPEAGEHEMRVQVNLDDGDTMTEDVRVDKRKTLNLGAQPDASVEDLGDSKPVHTWTNAQGQYREMYLIEDEIGENLNVYTTLLANDVVTVRRLANLPADRFEGTPEVSVDERGLITMKWISGEPGNEDVREIKLIDVTSNNPATMHLELKDALDHAMEDGPVKVKVVTEDSD